MNAHPFTLRQLQYAVGVADAGGFRRAAERCHVSQPSLSAQLAQLEAALGARLFERDRRRVLLTRAGEDLVARARSVLAGADDLATAARRVGDPLSGTLRIGVIPTVSPYFVPEAVPILRQRHAELVVVWIEEKTAAMIAELRAGRLDAALLALVHGMDDLDHEPVLEDPFVVVGRRGHPLLEARGPVTLRDLRGERVLLLEDGHCFRDQALELCSRARAGEAEYRATSLSTLAQMVAGGAGVTLLPQMSLAVENRRGELAARRFEAPAPKRSIVLAWRRQSPFAPALRRLAATLRRTRP